MSMTAGGSSFALLLVVAILGAIAIASVAILEHSLSAEVRDSGQFRLFVAAPVVVLCIVGGSALVGVALCVAGAVWQILTYPLRRGCKAHGCSSKVALYSSDWGSEMASWIVDSRASAAANKAGRCVDHG